MNMDRKKLFFCHCTVPGMYVCMYVCCCLKKNQSTPRPYVVFTLKTVLTYIQYPSLSYSSRQRNEFTFHKLTQNKVQKKEEKKGKKK